MHSICSHSLAASADNNYLHCYVDLYLWKNKQTNLTAASMANVSLHAGKIPGHMARNRKNQKDSVELSHRTRLEKFYKIFQQTVANYNIQQSLVQLIVSR